jgi:rsbT antagonist protein RsbS
VLVDVSAVALMDTEDFRALLQLVAAASLMGARTIMAGLQPGVVSALIELGVEAPALETALDIDDGFERLEAAREQDETHGGETLGQDPFGDEASDWVASQDGGAA